MPAPLPIRTDKARPICADSLAWCVMGGSVPACWGQPTRQRACRARRRPGWPAGAVRRPGAGCTAPTRRASRGSRISRPRGAPAVSRRHSTPRSRSWPSGAPSPRATVGSPGGFGIWAPSSSAALTSPTARLACDGCCAASTSPRRRRDRSLSRPAPRRRNGSTKPARADPKGRGRAPRGEPDEPGCEDEASIGRKGRSTYLWDQKGLSPAWAALSARSAAPASP